MVQESRCRYEKSFRLEIYAERLRHLYFELLRQRNILRLEELAVKRSKESQRWHHLVVFNSM